MDITALIQEAHRNSVSKGFWDTCSLVNTNDILAKLALIVSEVGEAIEAVRTPGTVRYSNLDEELADICIRVFDLARALGYDLESTLLAKMEVNRSRPYMHGKTA